MKTDIMIIRSYQNAPNCPTCVLKWPRCLCMSESDWKNTKTQLETRTSSPNSDEIPGHLEQLEPETDNDTDEVDYQARPANDRRKPEPY